MKDIKSLKNWSRFQLYYWRFFFVGMFPTSWKQRQTPDSDNVVWYKVYCRSKIILNWEMQCSLENVFIYLFIFNWRITDLQNQLLLFSVKPQHESAIGIHISLPFWTFLPPPSPSHPSRLIKSPCLSFLSHTANSCWLSILHMVM